MRSEVAEVETHPRSVQEKSGTEGVLENQGGSSKGVRGGQMSSGLPYNWVKPWLTMSHSAPVTCQCDWHEIKNV